MANNKEPYILLTEYQNLYKAKYGKVPTLNKFREKWAMQDVIDSVGYDRAKDLLQYYFKIARLDSETYYVDAVAVELNWPYFILLNVGTFVTCAVMLLLPTP